MAKLIRQHLIKAAERLGRLSFQAVGKEARILPLKNDTTFYNKVTLRQLLDQITLGRGGLSKQPTLTPSSKT